ncbi:hypothetical protein [Prosthecobacter sp.]|uniref:hypothetical protein n=1 Tax=Prosthecobacter sp. TaxID=1965333 RepID=UPI00378353F1
MAATILGTAHLYGVEGTVSNATVLSFRDKESAKNTAETIDENGNEIERRYDDVHNEVSIRVRARSGYTKAAPGSTITYNAITYEVVDTEKDTQNKGFREYTINAKKSAGISYS